MGQLFCIPMKDYNDCYYDTPRVKPVKDKPFEERNIGNYYVLPRVAPLKESKRRISIRSPRWSESIINHKPFVVQNNLKTAP